MDGILLMRLRDCAVTTKLGMIDLMFPQAYRALAAMGYVKKVGDGHQTTAQGEVYLADPQVRDRLRRF